jgi:hypothetical protein
MRSLRLLSANTFLLSTLVLAQSTSLINSPVLSQPNAATQASISENHGKLPLSFEANHGQAGPQGSVAAHESQHGAVSKQCLRDQNQSCWFSIGLLHLSWRQWR